MRPARVVPGDGLLHPIPLGALVVLVLNDHWWKRAYPSFVTGKLSDVAGLVFFPLLLQGIWEIGRASLGVAWGPSRQAAYVAAIATAVVFGLAKTWQPVNEIVCVAGAALRWPIRMAWAAARHAPFPPLGRAALARDPGDLAALPAVLVAVWIGRRRAP